MERPWAVGETRLVASSRGQTVAVTRDGLRLFSLRAGTTTYCNLTARALHAKLTRSPSFEYPDHEAELLTCVGCCTSRPNRTRS